jgi:alkanesulfonate monooxygenase SsuD/methylene tetrahydromethanopterin reductase-like flavin-dependent oxidoreductase (luciferase family)
LALANISQPPARLAPMADLYRQTAMQAGHAAAQLKLSIGTHMHIRNNSQDALNAFYPYYSGYFFTHTPSQYRAQEITRVEYDQRAGPQGAIFVGSPQQIIDKILYERELFGHQRFMAQIDIGGLPFAQVARVIELFATAVAPVIRREVGHV